ncbi:MAG: tetratricopeptide repeat protein [Lysobacteraceae bacterium]
MRLPERAVPLLVLLALVAAAGCSRLTFIKPKLERGRYTQVAPDYTVREDERDRKRMAAMDAQALAELALRQNQLDEAERQARAAVAADGGSADAHTVLGVALERRGDARQAGAEYAKAVALAPSHGIALNNYAAWLCGNGRKAEALPLFERALADPTYPTPATALANEGACALGAGQDALAAQKLHQAVALEPANPVALAALAGSEYRAGHYLEARAFSERRLAAAPATPEVLQLASQIEQKLGDTAAAARYVQRMKAEFPGERGVPGDAGQ